VPGSRGGHVDGFLCATFRRKQRKTHSLLNKISITSNVFFDEITSCYTKIYRWVQRYAPELEKHCRPRLKTTTDSWRVDKTYIKIKNVWMYLHQAVDSEGNTHDFWLSSISDGEAAKRFFLKTLAAAHTNSPQVINVDKNAAYPKALAALKAEGHLPERCESRQTSISIT
jgi:transposase-like protein